MRDLIVRCKHDPAFCSTLGQSIKAYAQRKLVRPLDQHYIITEFCCRRELAGSRGQIPALQVLLGQFEMEIGTVRRNGNNRSGTSGDRACQDRQRK